MLDMNNLSHYAEFQKIVKSMGLEPGQAAQLFINAVVGSKSIPFAIKQYDLPSVSSNSKPTPEQKQAQKPSKIYTLADLPEVTKTKPLQVHLNGETRRVSSWQGVLMNVLNMLEKMDNQKFANFEQTNYFEQTFKSSQRNVKKLMNGETIETNMSAKAIMQVVRTALNYYGWQNRFAIVLK